VKQTHSSIFDPLTPPRIELTAHELAVMTLRWCSYFGEHKIVKYLLDDFHLKVNTINCYSTWWIRMLMNERFELIRILLKHGARVSYSGQQNDNQSESHRNGEYGTSSNEGGTDGSRPLDAMYHLRVMASRGHVSATRFLLLETPSFQNDPVQFEMAKYNTLISGTMGNQQPIVDLLVKEFDVKLHQDDEDGDVFVLASLHGHHELLRRLWKIVDEQTNSTGYPSDTALQTCLKKAVEMDTAPVLEVLLSHPRLKGFGGHQIHALMVEACRHGKMDAVHCLVSNGADMGVNDFECVRVASRSGHFRLVNYLIHEYEHRGASLQHNVKNLRWKLVAKCKELWRAL
jgi:hypothetical protein